MITSFKKIIIFIICFSLAIPTQLFADFIKPSSDMAFIEVSGQDNLYTFNTNSPAGNALKNQYEIKGYTQWKEVLYGSPNEGQFRVYLPKWFDSNNMGGSANYDILKDMVENRRNKYGSGGLYLVNSSDWNVKYGWDLPYGDKENMYDANRGNITLPNGKKGELRYIGYNMQGEPVNNPYFPDDRESTIDAWEKNWIPFGPYGGMTEHKKSKINTNEFEAEKILRDFFLRHSTGQKMITSYLGKKGMDGKIYTQAFITIDGEKILTEEAFQYWNNRLRIEQNATDLNIMLTGNWKRDDGHVLYQTFTTPKIITGSTFIRAYRLTEQDSEKPLIRSVIREGSVGRTYGNAPISYINPFAFETGESTSRSMSRAAYTPDPKLPTFSLGGKYTALGEIVHAQIDPDKDGIDKNVGSLTKTQPQKILFQYQFLDEISNTWYTVSDQQKSNEWFWEGKEVLTPLVSDRTKSSLVVGYIKWPHDMNSPTRNYVKGRVSIKIPDIYKINEDDYWTPDNFTFLEFNIAPGNDLVMKEPIVLKNDKGKSIEGPEIGKDHVFEFTVDNPSGQTIDNPNVTVDIVITDKTTDKPIYEGTVEGTNPTGPKEETVITTPTINIPSNKIEACAVINKVHKDQNENVITTNDTVCMEFGSQQDMEMGSTVKLKDKNGKEVNSIAPNENHSLEFIVKHVKGSVEVGTPKHNSVANPNATIDVEITDGNKNVIHKQSYTAAQVLQPNGSIVIPTSRVIKTSSPTITACAVINKTHDEKGFNIRTDKDRVCETFTSINNLSVKELKVTPSIAENDTAGSMKKEITFSYAYAYDTSGSTPVNSVLTFKMNGTKMFEEPVSISPGQTLTGSKTGTVTIPSNGATFTVEINAARTHKEYIGSGKDAYADNKKSANVTRRVLPKCIDCEKDTAKTNKWQEKITWEKTVGDAKTYYGPFKMIDQNGNSRSCDGECTCPGTSSSGCHRDCNGHSGSHSSSCYDSKGKLTCTSRHTYYCSGCYTCHHYSYHYCSGHTFCVTGDWKPRIVSESPQPYFKYSEEYSIKKVYYKSKWSQDKFGGDGWIEVKNGDRVKVKVGYPFEVKVETVYKTDRKPGNVPQPTKAFNDDKGQCKVELKAPDYTDKARNPGVPTSMYLKLDGKECFIMGGSSSGDWWNQSIEHKLPSRPNKAGTGNVNAIYVSDKARPKQSIKVDLITQKWSGYNPGNVVAWLQEKKPLQDCMSFYIDIEANNDLNTGIIQ